MFIYTTLALLLIFCCSSSGFRFRANIAKIENRLSHGSKNTLRMSVAPAVITQVEPMNTIDQTWDILENTGNALLHYTKSSLFCRAFAAGCFVGFGGILSASVGFDIGGHPAWEPGNGVARFLSGAVGYPFSILMVANTGVGAWTGDLLPIARAWFGKKEDNSFVSILRFYMLTWLGSMCGAGVLALLASACDLPACIPCVAIAEHKLVLTSLQTFFRGVGGGSLICLAVFLANRNRDMIGKLIGIWFCISTYVIVDFEHVLASMFFMTAAKLSGATFTVMEMLKFFIPSTLGNLVGGSIVTGFCLNSIPKKTINDNYLSNSMKSKVAELEAKIAELESLKRLRA